MHGAFAPDEVFVLFDLPKEQTVYAYPSGAFGWLGIVSQGFRPELMTKDSSGAKLLASDAVLPHAHRVALPASVLWSRSLWVLLSPYSLRRKRKEPRMNSDRRGLKHSPGSPSLPHRI